MINAQLLDYVKQQLSLKVSKETILANLKTAGWTDADVSEVFKSITPEAVAPAPVSSIASSVTPNVTPVTVQPVSTIPHTAPAQPINLSESIHKSKKIIPVIAILVLLGLAGGAAGYAYYTGVFSFKKTETFEQVFTKAMDKINSQKYVKTTSEVSITIKDEKLITQLDLPVGTYPQINFSSDAVLSREDLNDSSGDKVSINTKFDLKNIMKDSILAKVDFLMPEPMIFYVKVAELTGLPEGMPSLSASLFQGKWWKIDIKALVENFAGAEADKILESLKDNQPSKEELEQIDAILKKYLKTAQVEKLADDSIDGNPSYHWSINFGKKQFVDMFMEILEVTRKDSTDQMDIKISEVKAGIETALNMIDIKPIEIFVKKTGYLPFKIQFSLSILNQDSTNIADVNMTYTTSSSEPINIEAPAESTDILYLLGPIVQSSLETARQKGKEAAIKANMSSIRAQAELFYDTHNFSYSGFCNSPELKSIRTAIENAGGTRFVCKMVAQKYSVGVKMLSDNSGYWCVDSTGVSKTTTTLPSGTVCPVK